MQSKTSARVASLLIIFTLLISPRLIAEVYKWTDASGKVHYSDQKPEKQPNAKEVTQDIKKANTDTSSQEQQKLGTIFRKENDADRNYQQQQARDAQPSPDQQERCQNARNFLKRLEGRIMIADENGKEVRFTDAERRVKAQELRDQINDNCSE